MGVHTRARPHRVCSYRERTRQTQKLLSTVGLLHYYRSSDDDDDDDDDACDDEFRVFFFIIDDDDDDDRAVGRDHAGVEGRGWGKKRIQKRRRANSRESTRKT